MKNKRNTWLRRAAAFVLCAALVLMTGIFPTRVQAKSLEEDVYKRQTYACLTPELVAALGLKEGIAKSLQWTHNDECLKPGQLDGMEVENDFTSFRAVQCQSRTPWRNVMHINCLLYTSRCV